MQVVFLRDNYCTSTVSRFGWMHYCLYLSCNLIDAICKTVLMKQNKKYSYLFLLKVIEYSVNISTQTSQSILNLKIKEVLLKLGLHAVLL